MESAQFARPGNDECRDESRWLLARPPLKLVLLISKEVLVIAIESKVRARKTQGKQRFIVFLSWTCSKPAGFHLSN